MTEPSANPARFPLPPGWEWARWSGTEESKQFWEDMGKDRGKLAHRFMEIVAAIESHRPLAKEKVHYDRGIGKAKVCYPSPGWRACFFQSGKTRFVTHISMKGEESHEADIQTALEAQSMHLASRPDAPKAPGKKSK